VTSISSTTSSPTRGESTHLFDIGYETGLDDRRSRHTRKQLKVTIKDFKFNMLHKSYILNKKGKDKKDKGN